MADIKSSEEVKKAILEKIAAKLALNTKNTVSAVRHAAHLSTHGSHGNRNH